MRAYPKIKFPLDLQKAISFLPGERIRERLEGTVTTGFGLKRQLFLLGSGLQFFQAAKLGGGPGQWVRHEVVSDSAGPSLSTQLDG